MKPQTRYSSCMWCGETITEFEVPRTWTGNIFCRKDDCLFKYVNDVVDFRTGRKE